MKDCTRRELAISAWARYCDIFQRPAAAFTGMTYPGFEDFRVDARMAEDIEMERTK